jgi:protein-tyrosine kinase
VSLLEKAIEKSNKTSHVNAISDDKPLADEHIDLADERIDLTEPKINKSKKQETIQFDKPKLEEKSQEVVTFNWSSLTERGFITPDHSHSQVAEEFRSIKRPLVANALGAKKQEIENSNLILITSSIPGEGKTFTAINLAFSIATEFDKKVLLVDADVAKPSVLKVLGIQDRMGLIDYLEQDSLDLSDVILQTEIAGLRIIPAGKPHKLSTELLASNKMLGLSKELSRRYSDRIVIFDSPPLLAATQAEVLASQMGQIVLVVSAESTPQTFVLESVKKLQSCSDVVLALLNRAQRNLHVGYYGYGKY